MPLNSETARGLALSDVISTGQWLSSHAPRIRSCCTSAEQCQPGDLFVVLDDPHIVSQELIEMAIQRGAVAILTERMIPCAIPQYLVDDIHVSFSQLCQAVAGSPADGLHTLGITGTYGKTTTAVLLNSILNQAGECPETVTADELAQGGPMQLAQRLAQSRLSGCSHLLLEASSDALARKHFSAVPLDAAIITNLRSEHTELHGSHRNYLMAKRQILSALKPDGVAVMNADDPQSAKLIPTIPGPAITFGMQNDAEIMATVLERHASEQTFLLDAGNESIAVRTQIIGDGHIYNCLAAAATALVLGIGPDAIVRGLEAVTSVPGRLQRIECGQPFGLFIDTSSSPHAIKNALRTLRQVTERNLICVAGVSARLSESERQDLGRALELHSDRSVLTGTQLERKLSLRNAHDVLDGYDRPAQAHLMPDRAKAICWSLSQAQPGDLVLVAGGGPVTAYDDANLCDEDVARYWLQESATKQGCPWLPA